MKKLIMFLAMAIMGIAMYSFKSPKAEEGWSRWGSFGNYPNIEYRTRKQSYNNYAKKWQWDYQFRNRYTQTVTFVYGYNELSSSCKPDHTEYKLPSGSQSDVYSALLSPGSTLWMCVDKVTF